MKARYRVLTLEERVTALEIWESAMTEANSHQFDTLQKGSLP